MFGWDLALLFVSLATIYFENKAERAKLYNQRRKCQNERRHLINETRPAPRLTASVQQLVRAIICDESRCVAGDKLTANEIKFRSMTDKNRNIEKHANFLKLRAMETNVRRISTRAVNPTTRRRNALFRKNVGSARYSPNRTTAEDFEIGNFYQDFQSLVKSPYI